MDSKIVYDFDAVLSRAGTHAEKYEARQRVFGREDVEPFWVADMDFAAPAFLIDRLRERLDHPLFGYTESYDEVFEAIAWWMKDQHAVTIPPDWIVLSPSVVSSISLAIQSFTRVGDAVVLLSPVYGPFYTCTTQNDRCVSDCPMHVIGGRFEIDFLGLETQLADPAVKLMLLCNPHNPGGRVWAPDELKKMAALCHKYQVLLFSDEIHCDIVYPPARHTSVLQLQTALKRMVMAHSIGKTFNCSGLQASFAVIPDDDLRARFQKTAGKVHGGDINLLGKVALETVFSPQGAVYKEQLTAYIQENIRQVCEILRSVKPLKVMTPEATYLVWCDFRSVGPLPDVFKRLVHDAGVGLTGGRCFGSAGEGWFRINCAHPRSQLIPAVQRIARLFA